MPARDTLSFSLFLFAGIAAVWLGIAGPLVNEVGTLGVWEWLNKWQALAGSVLAIFAAYIAARPVWSHLSEMRMHRLYTRVEHLRIRSVELERERNQIYALTSAIDLMADALFKLGETTAYPQSAQHASNLSRVESAQKYMDDKIFAFMSEMGPVWGSQEVQSFRSKMRDDAQRFSVATNKLIMPRPVPQLVTRKMVDEVALEAAPIKICNFQNCRRAPCNNYQGAGSGWHTDQRD